MLSYRTSGAEYYVYKTAKWTASGTFTCTVNSIEAGDYIAVVSLGGIYADNIPSLSSISNGTATSVISFTSLYQFCTSRVYSLHFTNTGSVTFSANGQGGGTRLGLSVVIIK